MTIPPKAADESLALSPPPDQITDRTAANYTPDLNKGLDPETIRLDTLWDITDEFVACVDALEKENLDSFTPDDLISFFKDHHCRDVLVPWADSQIQTSTEEGKIPRLENWRDDLANKSIGLDSLMNLAGLNSFETDQKAMDQRVREVLAKSEKATTSRA